MMKRYPYFLGILLATRLAFGAPVPPADKLLTSDTLAVFTIPDYTKASGGWQQSSSSRLWNDPSMKAFRDKFTAKLQSDLVAPLEREFGVKFSDYANLAQGQLTIAITQNGWDGKSDQTPGFLFLLDTKDKSDVLKTNLINLKKKWVDSGKQLKTDKIRDLEFTTLIFNSDDLSKTIDKIFPDPNFGHETLDAPKPKKPGKKVEWTIGQSESLLILGNSAKDIEKILIRQSGGAVPSLSEQASFASSYNSTLRDSSLYGWVNLKAIVDTITKQTSGNDGDAKRSNPQAGKIMAALGITGLQTLSFNLKDSTDGTLGNLMISIPESNRKGIFKAITAEAKDANPPPFVPADAVKFTRWRLDIQKTWATLENMLADINPQYSSVIKLVVDNAGKDKDANFDLRKNLIANLGDDVITFEKAPRKQTLADLSAPPSIVLIGSAKAEQLAASLKALGSLMPQQSGKVKEREFLGRKVYALSLPPSTVPGGGKPVEKTLHYAASGSYVAMSTDAAMLEEYLRGNTSKSLRDTPGLAEAAQKIGGMGTGLFGFENQAESMRTTLETLKKESGSLANLFGNSPLAGRLGMNEDDKKFKEWFDFSLLPNFDKIAKYFTFTVWGGSVNSEGLNFKMFAPTPPQMKN